MRVKQPTDVAGNENPNAAVPVSKATVASFPCPVLQRKQLERWRSHGAIELVCVFAAQEIEVPVAPRKQRVGTEPLQLVVDRFERDAYSNYAVSYPLAERRPRVDSSSLDSGSFTTRLTRAFTAPSARTTDAWAEAEQLSETTRAPGTHRSHSTGSSLL
jgi:hypothetical protein